MCRQSPGHVTVGNSRNDEEIFMNNVSPVISKTCSFSPFNPPGRRKDKPPRGAGMSGIGPIKRFTWCFSSLARKRVPEYYLLLAEAVRVASDNFRLMFRVWQSKTRATSKGSGALRRILCSAAQNSGAFSRRHRVGGCTEFSPDTLPLPLRGRVSCGLREGCGRT